MLRDSAVDLLMKRLGNRKDTALRDIIIGEMAFVQENILEQESELPWFLLKPETTLTTTADERLVALPDDFLLEWEDGELFIVDSTGEEDFLVKGDYDLLRANNTGTGKPKYYDFVVDNFALFPTPGTAYTLTFRYFAKASNLSGTYADANNIENTWLKHASALLMAETGYLVALNYLQSPKLANMFMQQREQARISLQQKTVAMSEINKGRSLGV